MCTVVMPLSACDWRSCSRGLAGAVSRKFSAYSQGPTLKNGSRCLRDCKRNVSLWPASIGNAVLLVWLSWTMRLLCRVRL